MPVGAGTSEAGPGATSPTPWGCPLWFSAPLRLPGTSHSEFTIVHRRTGRMESGDGVGGPRGRWWGLEGSFMVSWE